MIDINRNGLSPQERAQLDNLIASEARNTGILEYIAICDHPEIFEDTEEIEYE